MKLMINPAMRGKRNTSVKLRLRIANCYIFMTLPPIIDEYHFYQRSVLAWVKRILASHSQAIIQSVPPKGVIIPKIFIPLMLKAYNEPEKTRMPARKSKLMVLSD